jgi:hypothetical protein
MQFKFKNSLPHNSQLNINIAYRKSVAMKYTAVINNNTHLIRQEKTKLWHFHLLRQYNIHYRQTQQYHHREDE